MVSITHLSRDERLLLLLDRGSGLLSNLDVLLRGSREVGLVDRGCRLGGRGGGGGSLTTAEHLLGLSSVVAHELLGHLGGVGGVGASNLLELLSLGVDNVLRILKVVVDQLLVGGVDQGHSKEEGGGNERKTPVWNNLNEPVREEGANGDLEAHKKTLVNRIMIIFSPEGLLGPGLTVAEALTFSAKRMRWASMTKKLTSS